ncbi:MAG: hypothetical protein GF330_10070 [Candidatus Eisenbacteria bacterium]|nr:hypothetical protein [Candidatus Eisenbacteria bacterium]
MTRGAGLALVACAILLTSLGGCSRAPHPPTVEPAVAPAPPAAADSTELADRPTTAAADSAAVHPSTPAPPAPGPPVPVRTQAAPAAPAPAATHPAVAALLREARAARAVEDLNRAAELLERASRIQPFRAEIWLELARVRLAQRRFIEGAQLARKARQLAAGDRALAQAAREIERRCTAASAE